MDNFNLYSRYYDLLYQNKNYIAEVNYIRNCLDRYKPDTKTILEFGSGTGGHGTLLIKQGYSVFGLERSAEMITKAQSDGFPCTIADITDFKLDEKFDVVISLFHVISYLTTNKQLVAAFTNAAEHLNSKGFFIFDVWYSPAVYHLKAEPRIKKVENEQITVTRVAEPVCHTSKNIIDVNYTILVKDKVSNEFLELNELHPMRHFSIPEIELLADMCGFELVKAEDFLTAAEPSENTWGISFILQKRD
jgi:SAM-dependent methyltransferase